MTEQQFWDILQSAFQRRGENNPDFHCKAWYSALEEELEKLSPREILFFRKLYDERVWTADTVGILGANQLINGGSDSDYHYFRCWLVGRGKEVYERALANADSLADVLEGQWPIGIALDGAAREVWEEKTGRTKFDEFGDELRRLNIQRLQEDTEDDWDVEDDEELREHLPRLSRLYREDDEEGEE